MHHALFSAYYRGQCLVVGQLLTPVRVLASRAGQMNLSLNLASVFLLADNTAATSKHCCAGARLEQHCAPRCRSVRVYCVSVFDSGRVNTLVRRMGRHGPDVSRGVPAVVWRAFHRTHPRDRTGGLPGQGRAPLINSHLRFFRYSCVVVIGRAWPQTMSAAAISGIGLAQSASRHCKPSELWEGLVKASWRLSSH